jgi:predicted permease
MCWATSLVVAIVFQTVVVTPIIVKLLDTSGRRLWTLPLRVPVVLASAAGMLCALAGVHLPQLAARPLEILGGAAVPVALFALGMSLNAPWGSLTRPALVVATVLKVVAQPLAAWAIAHFLFGLMGPALLARRALCRAPPRRKAPITPLSTTCPGELSRDAVLVTSVLSLGSLSLIVWLLG